MILKSGVFVGVFLVGVVVGRPQYANNYGPPGHTPGNPVETYGAPEEYKIYKSIGKEFGYTVIPDTVVSSGYSSGGYSGAVPSVSVGGSGYSNVGYSPSGGYSSSDGGDNSITSGGGGGPTGDVLSALDTLGKAFAESDSSSSSGGSSSSSSSSGSSGDEVQDAILAIGKYFMNKDTPGGDIPAISDLQKAITTLSTALSDHEREPILANIFARVASQSIASGDDTKSVEEPSAAAPAPAASGDSSSVSDSTGMDLAGGFFPPSSDAQVPSGGYGPPTSSVGGSGGLPGLPLPPNPLAALIPPDAGMQLGAALKQAVGFATSALQTGAKIGRASFGIAGTLGTKTFKQVGITANSLGQVAGALGTGLSATLDNKGDALRTVGTHVTGVFATQ